MRLDMPTFELAFEDFMKRNRLRLLLKNNILITLDLYYEDIGNDLQSVKSKLKIFHLTYSDLTILRIGKKLLNNRILKWPV